MIGSERIAAAIVAIDISRVTCPPMDSTLPTQPWKTEPD